MMNLRIARPSSLVPGDRVRLLLTRWPTDETRAALADALRRDVPRPFVVEAVDSTSAPGATLVTFVGGASCFVDEAAFFFIDPRTSSEPARTSALRGAPPPVVAPGHRAPPADGARGPIHAPAGIGGMED